MHKLFNLTKKFRAIFLGVFLCGLIFGLGSAQAQTDAAAVDQPISLWSTIAAGGLIGYLILIMSLVSVSFIIEHFVSIRKGVFLPEQLEQQLDETLEQNNIDHALEICKDDDSFLAMVISSGLQRAGSVFGFFDMQSAMQETSEREISRLYRKLEYLTFIAASAPMLGLLGTVTGMIASFNQIALTEGTAKPSQLAGGISEALVTTCLGLVVAIPTMFFVAFFRNRIDGYIAETETVVERLMGRFRKGNSAQ